MNTPTQIAMNPYQDYLALEFFKSMSRKDTRGRCLEIIKNSIFDINHCLNHKTALFEVVSKGNLGCCAFLLEMGADVEKGRLDKTPLMEASRKGFKSICKLLVENGADIMKPDLEGKTAFSIAVESDKEKICEIFLSKIPNAKSVIDKEHYLHKALYYDCTNVCKLLMKNGADLNALDEKKGYTPFIYSMMHYEYDCQFSLLLETKGVDINKPSRNGVTPLMIASKSYDTELFDELIKRHPNIDAEDDGGNTALHHAIYYPRIHQFEVLIEKGADINKPNKKGNTPLHISVKRNNSITTISLIRKGADIECLDDSERTPFSYAVEKDTKATELLLQKGVNINQRDIDKRTPLHHAVSSRNLTTCNLLIHSGADLNVTDVNGHTPLSLAPMKEIRVLLVAKGAVLLRNDVNDQFLEQEFKLRNERVHKFFINEKENPESIFYKCRLQEHLLRNILEMAEVTEINGSTRPIKKRKEEKTLEPKSVIFDSDSSNSSFTLFPEL